MTKYEEICSAYATARKSWQDHRQACRDFASDLARKLAENIAAPREEVMFLPPNIEYDPHEVRPIEEALRYGADSAFHYGLALRVRAAADNPMTEVLLLQISLSRNPGGFELRVAGLHEPFRIPLDFGPMSKGHQTFLDTFAKRAISTYAEHDLRYADEKDFPRVMLR